MDIFKERRSIRSFKDEALKKEDLDYIADCARLAPSAANLQPLKLCVVTEKAAEVFEYTKWAGYLEAWNPKKDEAPPAYIALLGDLSVKSDGFDLDAGIAGAAVCYAAQSLGISSCWLGAIDRKKISELLELSSDLKLLYLIALGKANQKSFVCSLCEETDKKEAVKYKMNDEGVVFVPKKSFESTVIYR